MTTNPREKWNRIYDKRTTHGQAAAVLRDNEALILEKAQEDGIDQDPGAGQSRNSRKRALDIACGDGANAVYLAQRGFDVDAWDISDVAIGQVNALAQDQNLRITGRALDITAVDLPPCRYDIIINCHYLDRSLIPAMIDAATPGGLIFYQTFTANKTLDIGPSNPKFLLAPGELNRLFAHCHIRYQSDGSDITDQQDPMAGRASIVAQV